MTARHSHPARRGAARSAAEKTHRQTTKGAAGLPFWQPRTDTAGPRTGLPRRSALASAERLGRHGLPVRKYDSVAQPIPDEEKHKKRKGPVPATRRKTEPCRARSGGSRGDPFRAIRQLSASRRWADNDRSSHVPTRVAVRRTARRLSFRQHHLSGLGNYYSRIPLDHLLSTIGPPCFGQCACPGHFTGLTDPRAASARPNVCCMVRISAELARPKNAEFRKNLKILSSVGPRDAGDPVRGTLQPFDCRSICLICCPG